MFKKYLQTEALAVRTTEKINGGIDGIYIKLRKDNTAALKKLLRETILDMNANEIEYRLTVVLRGRTIFCQSFFLFFWTVEQ